MNCRTPGSALRFGAWQQKIPPLYNVAGPENFFPLFFFFKMCHAHGRVSASHGLSVRHGAGAGQPF